MHEQMNNTDNSCVAYRAINLYSASRCIWFIVDPPHLMKTTRKCTAHSRISIYLFNKSNKMTTK